MTEKKAASKIINQNQRSVHISLYISFLSEQYTRPTHRSLPFLPSHSFLPFIPFLPPLCPFFPFPPSDFPMFLTFLSILPSVFLSFLSVPHLLHFYLLFLNNSPISLSPSLFYSFLSIPQFHFSIILQFFFLFLQFPPFSPSVNTYSWLSATVQKSTSTFFSCSTFSSSFSSSNLEMEGKMWKKKKNYLQKKKKVGKSGRKNSRDGSVSVFEVRPEWHFIYQNTSTLFIPFCTPSDVAQRGFEDGVTARSYCTKWTFLSQAFFFTLKTKNIRKILTSVEEKLPA